MALMIDLSRLGGRYSVDRLLYTRGVSSGYLARDERSGGRQVVLEVSPTDERSGVDGTRVEDQQAMFGMLRALEHPNLVTLLDCVLDPPYFAVVKAWEPGDVLTDWLASATHAPTERPLRISFGRDILEGLAALHDAGIVHRDLSPRSVWVTLGSPRPLAQIDHFHLAVACLDEYVDEARPGALGQQAPEVVRSGTYSRQSDVYAAGLVLLELLASPDLPSLDAKNDAEPFTDPFADLDALSELGGRVTEELVRRTVRPPFTEVIIRATRRLCVERFDDGLDLLAAFDAMDLERRLREAGIE